MGQDTLTGANGANQPLDPPATPFTIGVTDADGNSLPAGDPCTKEARGIDFDVHIVKDGEPSAADMEFYRDLTKIEHALVTLYPAGDTEAETRFRPQFVRLFHLARLVLEGDVNKAPDGTITVGKRLSPDAAKAEIAALAADIIEDEAPRIKNTHLRQLAAWAGALALPFVLAYAVLLLWGQAGGSAPWLAGALARLKIEAVPAANFMLLWVGCFVGVCLSYTIRTHSFSLTDLTRTDADYLAPAARLLMTGAFAMLLALFAVVGLGEVAFGASKLSDIATQPMLAFVVGAVLGISEQKLSGTVEKRAGDLFGGATK